MINRELKDSAIPWIGDIPKGWGVNLLSSLFDEHKQKNKGLVETNLLSLSYGKIIRKDINTKEGLLPESFDGYNVISSGDIVFRLTDLQNDKRSLRTGLCTENGIITSAYVSIRGRHSLNSAYYHYLFHSYDLCKVFYGMGEGVRQGMNYGDLRKLLILLPSLSEQKKIASFLDRKCAEIDEMIALQENIVEELKAYKQSVITEAVTKGLNPDAPMKDSGIEWIGEIPEHYICSKLKYYVKVDSGDAISNEIIRSEGVYPVYGGGEIMGYHTESNTSKNSLVIGRVGARCGCVTMLSTDCWATDNALVLKTDVKLKFMYYLLIGVNLNRLNTSNAQPLITATKVKNEYIPLPPKCEQELISDYLDTKCTEIDNLISIKLSKIDSLKEYKKSIIYEYVTGKKEVIF